MKVNSLRWHIIAATVIFMRFLVTVAICGRFLIMMTNLPRKQSSHLQQYKCQSATFKGLFIQQSSPCASNTDDVINVRQVAMQFSSGDKRVFVEFFEAGRDMKQPHAKTAWRFKWLASVPEAVLVQLCSLRGCWPRYKHQLIRCFKLPFQADWSANRATSYTANWAHKLTVASSYSQRRLKQRVC